MARLDRLGPVKEVAQIGAAIGREFSYDIVKAVANRPDDRLRDELNQLVEAGLIFQPRRAAADVVCLQACPRPGRRLWRRCCAVGARSFTRASPRRSKSRLCRPWVKRRRSARVRRFWPITGSEPRSGKRHSHYTLEAAERAQKLFARPEAINHYWQALELLERLPHTPERSRVHCDVILSLVQLPGWMRNEEAEARLFRHVDQALTDATEAGQMANMARLEAIKGRYSR